MFTEVSLTRRITENYSDFTACTLLEKKPIKNWPRCLGEKSIPIIKQESDDGNRALKLLVAHGGTGRTTLEIIKQCSNLSIDHTDVTANSLQVLQRLLSDSRLDWCQQVEGTITQGMQYCLEPHETERTLLKEKGNSINYLQTDYAKLHPQLDNYDIIVADFRYKDAADELMFMSSRLKAGGVLILGSIDDVNIGLQYGQKHSSAVLQNYYTPMGDDNGCEYPHIYCETRCEYQYAISYFSAWRKLSELPPSAEKVSNKEKCTSLTTDEYYEDESVLASYTQFHFGAGLLGVKNFPLRMAEVCIEACKKYNTEMKTALDAGCGPGRTAIELCTAFERVEGYDYSHSFVDMILKQKEEKRLSNLIAYQGDSHKQIEICQNKQFDLILGCNSIDRLHSPEEWVLQSKAMISENGLLIIASPYQWKPEHTDPAKYIGGFTKDGEDYYTVNGLCELLEPELLLLEELQIPFVIPEADGTYEYAYSNCTVFGAPR